MLELLIELLNLTDVGVSVDLLLRIAFVFKGAYVPFVRRCGSGRIISEEPETTLESDRGLEYPKELAKGLEGGQFYIPSMI